MSLFWHMPSGNYLLIDEVLEYRPNNMVSVLSAGYRLYVRKEALVVL